MEQIQMRIDQKRRKRIMVVEDHAMTCLGLKQIIANESDLMVCGEAAGISETLQRIGELSPDLLMVDISLKDGSGLDLIEQVRKQHPGVKMLVSSMHNESLFADRALQAGALGYICKYADIDQIVKAIRQVLKGRVYLSEDMSERILCRRTPMKNSVEMSFTDALSNRELEVFQMIGEGRTRRQLAQSLHISVKTVETHQENIKKKLNLKSSQEVVCRAVEWVLESKRKVLPEPVETRTTA